MMQRMAFLHGSRFHGTGVLEALIVHIQKASKNEDIRRLALRKVQNCRLCWFKL